MAITINIQYIGKNGSAQKFAQEMIVQGIVDAIRKEDGNERYDYYISMDDPETVLLIDVWKNQEALDIHHSLPLMQEIAALREKYDLHMKVERYSSDDQAFSKNDEKFIRH